MLHFYSTKRWQTFCSDLKGRNRRQPVDRPECLRVQITEPIPKRFQARSRTRKSDYATSLCYFIGQGLRKQNREMKLPSDVGRNSSQDM